MRVFIPLFAFIFQIVACSTLPNLADVHLPEGHELESMNADQLRQHYPHLLSRDTHFLLPGEKDQLYQIDEKQLRTLWGKPHHQSQNWLDRLPSGLALGTLVYPDPLIALGVVGTTTMLMPIPASSRWQGKHLQVTAYSHPLFKGAAMLRWFDKEGGPIYPKDYQKPRGALSISIGRRISMTRDNNTVSQLPQRDVFHYSLGVERSLTQNWHGQSELSYNWSQQARSNIGWHRFQYSNFSMGVTRQLFTHLRVGMAVSYQWSATVQTQPNSGSRFTTYRYDEAPGLDIIIDMPITISRLQLAWQIRQFNTTGHHNKAQHLSLSARALIF